jgi:hypothetical protein
MNATFWDVVEADGEKRRLQQQCADAGGGHGEEAAGTQSSGTKAALDQTKDLYGLHELLDQAVAGRSSTWT